MTQRIEISSDGFMKSIKDLNEHLDEICGRSHVVYFSPFQYFNWEGNGNCVWGRLTYTADDDAPEEALAIARKVVEDYSNVFNVSLENTQYGLRGYKWFRLWR